MIEQLVIQNSAPWWIQFFDYLIPHWWGIAAIIVAPLVGYAATRRYNAHAVSKPSDFRLAAIAGMVTFVLSFLMWWKGYHDIGGAVLIAIIMGVGYPIMVTGLMGAVKKWWPWGYKRLQNNSSTEDKTIENGNDSAGSGKPFSPKW